VPPIVSDDTFALAQERLDANKTHAPRRTITPSVVQGLVSCAKCRYALYRTSTRSSARAIHYYRCLVLRDKQGEKAYCLIHKCSRGTSSLPHLNAPEHFRFQIIPSVFSPCCSCCCGGQRRAARPSPLSTARSSRESLTLSDARVHAGSGDGVRSRAGSALPESPNASLSATSWRHTFRRRWTVRSSESG